MKKNIVLAMVVLAMLVVPAFATPSFSGEFSWATVYDFDADGDKGWEDLSNGVEVDLSADMSDFTSLEAVIAGDEGDVVEVDTMILSQDLTGALGIDGPVTFEYSVGMQDYEVQSFSIMEDPSAVVGVTVEANEDGDVNDDDATLVVGEDSKLVGMVATIGMMGLVNVDVALYPSTYTNELAGDEEFAVNVYGEFGPAEVSVYYVASEEFDFCVDSDDDDIIDEAGQYFGFNAGAAFGAVEASVMFEYDIEEETSVLALAGAYEVAEDIAVEAGIVTEDLGDDDFDFAECSAVEVKAEAAVDALEVEFGVEAGDLSELAAETEVSLALAYELGDLTLYTAVQLGTLKDFDAEDDLTYEIGATVDVDSVTYNLGYMNGSDEFSIEDDDVEKGLYLSVTASF